MGLELAASSVPSAKPLSVVVAGVVEGSPAEKAGVLTGDELSAVDGEEVKVVIIVVFVVLVVSLFVLGMCSRPCFRNVSNGSLMCVCAIVFNRVHVSVFSQPNGLVLEKMYGL